jgi:signal transduction histidine kinase
VTPVSRAPGGGGQVTTEGDLAVLRRTPLFAELSDEDLAWIGAACEPLDLAAGSVLAAEGDPGDALFVVVSGEIEVVKRSRTTDVPLAVLGPGEIVGEMAVLEDRPRNATVQAAGTARVLRIRRGAILDLLRNRPTATMSMLRTVTGRLRSTEAMLREREKLAALGVLSAGLAHELNNPAAAVQRSAALLPGALAELARAAEALGPAVSDPAVAGLVAELASGAAPGGADRAPLDPLAASDLELALEGSLERHGVDDAAALASALLGGGWDEERVERVASAVAAPAFRAVIRWVGAAAAAHALVDEVATGARRISEIVRAVKEYTFMDRAPVQQVDLRAGLDNTLVILRPKLRDGITVVREYDPDLPEIEAFGSELNQVWTNLLDNAADALGGHGTIRIRAFRRGPDAVVLICDDGPGIAPEVRDRIFEPFFTTKPPGSGTGLGLHISHGVIARHGGRIEVRSRPGETCFEVTVPTTHRI